MTREGEGTPLPAACTQRLVIAGAYRFIRNPMALSGICQGVAVGLAIGSPLIMLYAVIGGLWWDILVRPDEEQHLLESFGEPFEKYQSEVPCWRPRFKPFKG